MMGLRPGGSTGLRPGGGASLRPGGAVLGGGARAGGVGSGGPGSAAGAGTGGASNMQGVNPVRPNAPPLPKEFVEIGSKDESGRIVYTKMELGVYSSLTEK